MKIIQSGQTHRRRNPRKKQSTQVKVRQLNEALQFLVEKKMKTWKEGGRKGHLFCMAVRAFMLGKENNNKLHDIRNRSDINITKQIRKA